MQKLKRRGALALSLLLLASLLAACGSSGNTAGGNTAGNSGGGANSGTNASNSENAGGVKKDGFPIVDEPLTLTMFAPDAGMADWNTMPVTQEMEKLSGNLADR